MPSGARCCDPGSPLDRYTFGSSMDAAGRMVLAETHVCLLSRTAPSLNIGERYAYQTVCRARSNFSNSNVDFPESTYPPLTEDATASKSGRSSSMSKSATIRPRRTGQGKSVACMSLACVPMACALLAAI
jgi:hypothetical protein